MRDQIEVDQAAVHQMHAERADLHQSAAVFVQADRANLDQSAAVAVVGRDVAARNVTTLVLLSPRVSGTVRTVFDLRAAFAFGLGIVLGRRLLRLLRLH